MHLDDRLLRRHVHDDALDEDREVDCGGSGQHSGIHATDVIERADLDPLRRTVRRNDGPVVQCVDTANCVGELPWSAELNPDAILARGRNLETPPTTVVGLQSIDRLGVVADPPLKLVLFEGAGEGGSINHLGVEVESSDQVVAAEERISAEGISTTGVDDTLCCYAEKTETWVESPEGRWEWYVKTGDSEEFDNVIRSDDTTPSCC